MEHVLVEVCWYKVVVCCVYVEYFQRTNMERELSTENKLKKNDWCTNVDHSVPLEIQSTNSTTTDMCFYQTNEWVVLQYLRCM